MVRNRKNKKAIGFNSFSTSVNLNEKECYENIIHEEIQKFGIIPELVGRLPVLAALNPLETEELVKILKEPKNAIIKQYQKMFSMDGVTLEFEDDAIEAIAETANKQKTGARGLRAIIENIMLEIMFTIPEQKDLFKCTITKDVVLKNGKPRCEIKEKTA